MAAKKTNYIGLELKWLEKRCKQLMLWCQDKLNDGIRDRLERTMSARGTEIIKVISSEETQVKTLTDTLQKLPGMLIEINRLRKEVEKEDTGPVGKVRGDYDIPGFMDDDGDLEDDTYTEFEDVKETKPKKQSAKKLPAPKKKKVVEEEYTDEDITESNDDFDPDDDYEDFEDA